MGAAPPIRERHKPVPLKLHAELRVLLQGMLHSRVITYSLGTEDDRVLPRLPVSLRPPGGHIPTSI